MINRIRSIALLRKIPVKKTLEKCIATIELTGMAVSAPVSIGYIQPQEAIIIPVKKAMSTKPNKADWIRVQQHIADMNRIMLLKKSEFIKLKKQKALVLKIMQEDKNCSPSTDKNKIADYIVILSKEYNIDPVFIACIAKKETHFTENLNGKNGKGMMQLTSIAVKDMYTRPNLYHSGLNKIKEKYPTYESLFEAIQSDPELNLKIGIIAFAQRLNNAKGNLKIALQNYNGSSQKIAYANDIMKDIQKYNI